ncbi:terminase small subunit [Thomasclavelia ramosa]|uniref:terminase small subunit n=1 Tax=Thomasclavelia ramosa TaxID=1547 RepID=UPI0022E194EB|nr:terminase small subunit [Thomasclavelia ramosa]
MTKKHKPRTKEALLDKAESLNIDVDPDKLYTLNDIARTKAKINNTTSPINQNETRGGERSNTPSLSSISDPINAKLLEHAFKYWNVPMAKNDEEIAQRIEFYFNDCYKNQLKPTLEGCALAIGTTTQTLYNWSEKDSKSEFDRFDLAKRIRQLLSDFDANLLINGKMNPVAYIFRAKNYYGMKDQTESIVKHENNLGETKTADELLEIIEADVIETD